MLQGTTDTRLQLGAQHPTHPGGSDKTEEGYFFAAYHFCGNVAVLRYHVTGVILGDTGLVHGFNQLDAGKRRIGRRLDHAGTAGGKGGDYLVYDQVQGVVEGTEGQYHTAWKFLGKTEAPGGGRLVTQWDYMTAFLTDRLNSFPDAGNCPGCLHSCVNQRFAALGGN